MRARLDAWVEWLKAQGRQRRHGKTVNAVDAQRVGPKTKTIDAQLVRIQANLCVDENGCWIWTGKAKNLGYGVITLGGCYVKMHRLMWVLFRGFIPGGLCVCHHCDVRACNNPEHLFLATLEENDADCRRKGRHTRLPGENNPQSKLKAGDVVAIWRLSKTHRHCDVARQFGVSQATVCDIICRRTWRHLIMPEV